MTRFTHITRRKSIGVLIMFIIGFAMLILGITLTAVFSNKKVKTETVVNTVKLTNAELRSFDLTLDQPWNDTYANASSNKRHELITAVKNALTDGLKTTRAAQNVDVQTVSIGQLSETPDNKIQAYVSAIYVAYEYEDIPSVDNCERALNTHGAGVLSNVTVAAKSDPIQFCSTYDNNVTIPTTSSTASEVPTTPILESSTKGSTVVTTTKAVVSTTTTHQAIATTVTTVPSVTTTVKPTTVVTTPSTSVSSTLGASTSTTSKVVSTTTTVQPTTATLKPSTATVPLTTTTVQSTTATVIPTTTTATQQPTTPTLPSTTITATLTPTTATVGTTTLATSIAQSSTTKVTTVPTTVTTTTSTGIPSTLTSTTIAPSTATSTQTVTTIVPSSTSTSTVTVPLSTFNPSTLTNAPTTELPSASSTISSVSTTTLEPSSTSGLTSISTPSELTSSSTFSTSESTISTSTEPSTTQEPTTMPVPTGTTLKPVQCLHGATYVQQNVVVIYDMSNSTVLPRSTTETFITNIFNDYDYDIGNINILRTLPLPFPDTEFYNVPNNYAIKDTTYKNNVFAQFYNPSSVTGSKINDALIHVKDHPLYQSTQRPRTLVIIAQGYDDIDAANVTATDLKQSWNIVTVAVGNANATTLQQLATNSSYSLSANLQTSEAQTNVTGEIKKVLANICSINNIPTTTPKPTTLSPTTSTTTIPSTTSTPLTCVNQSIAFMIDMSNSYQKNNSDGMILVDYVKNYGIFNHRLTPVASGVFAPFPNTDNFESQMGGFGLISMAKLNTLQYYVKQYYLTTDVQQSESRYINDTLYVIYENAKQFKNDRSVILFASINDGIANGTSVATVLKHDLNFDIYIVKVGTTVTNDVCKLATDTSHCLSIPDLSNTTQVQSVFDSITLSMLQKSPTFSCS